MPGLSTAPLSSCPKEVLHSPLMKRPSPPSLRTCAVSSPAHDCGPAVLPGATWCPAARLSGAGISSSESEGHAGSPRCLPAGQPATGVRRREVEMEDPSHPKWQAQTLHAHIETKVRHWRRGKSKQLKKKMQGEGKACSSIPGPSKDTESINPVNIFPNQHLSQRPSFPLCDFGGECTQTRQEDKKDWKVMPLLCGKRMVQWQQNAPPNCING